MAPVELELEHTPVPRPPSGAWLSAYDVAKVAFFLFGFPRNGFGSVDVTSRCNLRCRHCYYFAGPEEDLPRELSADQWEARLQELRRSNSRWQFPFFNCTWVGGDPLLRQDVIARCKPYFRYNTIVTNGTIPLPNWPDVNWYISIDGDETLHEELRDPSGHFRRNGRPGIYRRIVDNVSRNRHLGVTIAYCITRDNVRCIEQVVKDWNAAGAKHITFDFFTPVAGLDDRMWLDFAERDAVLDKLVALRRIYGDFFVIPERVLRLMRSDRCREVTATCLLARRSFALDAGGRQKGKCVMGDAADCSRCGCVVPFYLRSLTDRPLILGDVGRELATAGRRLASDLAAHVLP
ncbi:MAG: radical SAM protein [Deltaproteobacteria bacterium]|nr:radical SAM protein [Deltaproteobacteria bacterium]